MPSGASEVACTLLGCCCGASTEFAPVGSQKGLLWLLHPLTCTLPPTVGGTQWVPVNGV